MGNNVNHQGAEVCLAILLEYAGTRYYGFQKQRSLPTIQGELEQALYKLTGEVIRVTGASRTDTGVHATGQVVSFNTASGLKLERLVSGLNHYLPEDIAIQAIWRAHLGFDARRHAQSREYRYTILNSPSRSPIWREWAWQVERPLNITAMRQALGSLVGRRDFAPFATALEPKVKSTIRHLYRAEIGQQGGVLFIDMEANSFLPHQVRNTVGALVAVGLGRTSVEHFWAMAESHQRGMAGPTAPPQGLCLTKVSYKQHPEALRAKTD